MSKITLSKTAIIGLTEFVLNNYGQVRETVFRGIEITKKIYSNSKLTISLVYDLFKETGKYMQAVENEGVLKGIAKKEAVLEFIVKEYLETTAEIKAIWAGWKDTVSWFIDQIITMLNSGRNVLHTFAG